MLLTDLWEFYWARFIFIRFRFKITTLFLYLIDLPGIHRVLESVSGGQIPSVRQEAQLYIGNLNFLVMFAHLDLDLSFLSRYCTGSGLFQAPQSIMGDLLRSVVSAIVESVKNSDFQGLEDREGLSLVLTDRRHSGSIH